MRGQLDTMVATAIQQLSARPFAVSIRAPSAAQGRRCSLVVRSEKSQNEALRAAQQAVRCNLRFNVASKAELPLQGQSSQREHPIMREISTVCQGNIQYRHASDFKTAPCLQRALENVQYSNLAECSMFPLGSGCQISPRWCPQFVSYACRDAKLPALVRPAALVAISNALMALPAHAEAGKIFDFNLTLPIMATQFLLLMVFLDKFWFGPVGKVLDERDGYIREQLQKFKVHLLQC